MPASKLPPSPDSSDFLQPITLAHLQLILSSERLQAYRLKDDTDLDVVVRYFWNISLCEAFYPALQNLEIAFRNSLHTSLSAHFNNAYWMWNDPPLADPRDREEVERAEDNLQRRRKPLEPPRMVAELTFGFWTRLLDRRYERVLWPQLLKPVFPFLPASVRRRDFVLARFEAIRHLRNRISHHEPIWNRSLLKEHSEILDAIGWISPPLQAATQITDRLVQVHSQKYVQSLRDQLTQNPSS